MATQVIDLPFVAPLDYPSLAKKRDVAIKFDSIGEFVAHLKAQGIKAKAGGRDSWYGGDPDLDLQQCLTGNLANVERSDKYLDQLESLISYTSSKFKVIDDIQGGVPNVAAYLAGSPMNMRRRQRQESDLGPLTICVDLSSSAGVSVEALEKRAAAILALVRVLSSKRPVVLWAGCQMDGFDNGASACWTRLETAPLDLARVAHFLTSISVTRSWSYSLLMEKYGSKGHWPFNDAETSRKVSKRSLERHMEGEVLHIAGVFLKDKSIENPQAWLAETIKEFSHKED